MLGLQLPTDPRWANLASKQLDEILIDHAYCEQKAASTCISIIQAFPELEELVNQLSPVVTEEWGHFRLVLRQLQKRGYSLGRQRKDEYVQALIAFVKRTKGQSREQVLLDKLLLAALIEARSCERFKLLWKHFDPIDDELSTFYKDLMIAEANHYTMFLDLAKHYIDEETVKQRWEEWLAYEAEVLQSFELRGDRVH